MNMFRDLAILALIGLGVAVSFADPMSWKIMGEVPVQISEGMNFLMITKPFSAIICYALALALFMTRLRY